MIFEAFRVQMYKCILDSGWIDVEQLTTLIGKNESGKTSLLKGLHKFKPFKTEPYVMDKEWPRGHRSQRDKNFPVCTTRFRLTPGERRTIGELIDEDVEEDLLAECARTYDGRLTVKFTPGISAGIPEKIVIPHMNRLRIAPPGVNPALLDTHSSLVRQVEGCLVHEGVGATRALVSAAMPLLQNALASSIGDEIVLGKDLISALKQALDVLLQDASSMETKRVRAEKFVLSKLPTFIYMDDYRTFQGSALLDQVKQRQDSNSLSEEDKTLLMILGLSGLDLNRLHSQAGEADKEQRQYDLNDAGVTLTDEIEGRWKQKKYEVTYAADGQQFFTFVRDEKDKALIRLEERSKGFQWFFSFDLLFMFESQGNFKDCVLLLDEPGLHLHPEAQTDLLGRLERYAEGNTLIYSTHLPFMIDLTHPERIRVISEGESGTFVTKDLNVSQPEGKLTLQAALGIGGRTSYLVAEKNLVVEGVDDYWIISALSNLSKRSGGIGLSEDVLITAAGGASEATYIATFMIGQELEVVALYDTDDSGNTAKDKLVNKWLGLYKENKATALSLGPALGIANREFAIEDLFPEDFYLTFVQRTYDKQLKLAGVDQIVLPKGNQLIEKRVEAFFQEKGLKYNKGSVAKRICADLNKMTKFADLPNQLQTMAAKLLAAINEAFPDRAHVTAAPA